MKLDEHSRPPPWVLWRARAARAGAIIASEGTDSEVQIAARAQTSRVTVRRALGK